MEHKAHEVLEINNFLSIKSLRWEFNEFNIITGDMGIGKSLCVKLLLFFESMITDFLVLPFDNFRALLDPNKFFEKLAADFFDNKFVVHNENKANEKFKINYKVTYKENTVEITVNQASNNSGVRIDSVFLRELLNQWQCRLENIKDITADGFRQMKLEFYDELSNKFDGYFPMATTFVPASRASLAFNSSHNDDYLRKFNDDMNMIRNFRGNHLELMEEILKAKIRIDKTIELVSGDGRAVPLSKASSGQQEIFHVLLLLTRLGSFMFTYGRKNTSVFIEEPSAHLFPLEQKQTLELMARVFNELKENHQRRVRFIVTTHSPYVLNTINNMLKKGYLIDIINSCNDVNIKQSLVKKLDNIKFPHLCASDVSAFFIKNDGTLESMMQDFSTGAYLYDCKIEEITEQINNDYNSVRDLLKEAKTVVSSNSGTENA
jgi:predicted ATPase